MDGDVEAALDGLADADAPAAAAFAEPLFAALPFAPGAGSGGTLVLSTT